MKTFKNFYEDTGELRQQLGALDKEEESTRKLEARRRAAKERIDRLSGSNDTEQRLATKHSADLERIKAIQAAKKQRQKRSNNISNDALPNAVKAGAKIALKTGKRLIKKIKNRVNTNPQSSS